MTHLVKVYSPDGEAFENSPENARDLVIHAGWSLTDPNAPKGHGDEAPHRVAEVLTDAETNAVAVPPNPIEELSHGSDDTKIKIEDGADTASQESGSASTDQGTTSSAVEEVNSEKEVTNSEVSDEETVDGEATDDEVVDGETKSRGRPRKNKE